jgi:hypothetical protein
MSMAKDFGESNEAAIARWGVATCRDLVQRTQAWGDGTAAKKKQENAILKDANRAVYSISRNNKLVRRIKQRSLTGLVIDGELALFTPSRNLTTPQEVNDFIDLNRTTRKGRVPRLNSQSKGITPATVFNQALKIRKKRSGIAKGGWIGAGIAIGKKQRKGSRITIGKNFANYAHKFQSGGTASMTRSVWNPVGKITNNVAYVSTEHVLKASDSRKAINEGGKLTIKWYEKSLAAKLKRRNR